MLKHSLTESKLEAGCDEAGRGCLAGPVVAAAVIWPRGVEHEFLNDSKQLSKKKREALVEEIKEIALDFAIAEIDHETIDKINILNASYRAMNKAVDSLNIKPQHLLIDGNRFSGNEKIPHTCIVKGDGKFLSIAAASILAKVYRDKLMEAYSVKYPGYGWERNAGYGTKEHREAIELHGITPIHRKTFLTSFDQLDLFTEL